MTTTAALRIQGLSKSFGRPAVQDLDLTIQQGELYALLGPNGAGKTTTLRMVTGLLAPDAGKVEVLGVDLASDAARAKMSMAYLPDDPMLYAKLSRPSTSNLSPACGAWTQPSPSRAHANCY
jgi:ABC-2 type transport system ATP-binding protein